MPVKSGRRNAAGNDEQSILYDLILTDTWPLEAISGGCEGIFKY
jgi:hypothetical protein